ncbi:MAG: NTP transferase domain-containing protein [Rhodospirillales bacterium]
MGEQFRIACIVLAAGQSSRAGPENKLLKEIDGRPMILKVVDTVLETPARPVIVVTGHEAPRIDALVRETEATTVRNRKYKHGMGTSIARGIDALPPDAHGTLVCLGDMPHVGAETIRRLIGAFDPHGGREICVPATGGRYGNPVLFGQRFFLALRTLDEDRGGKSLVADNAGMVFEVEVGDEGIFVDDDGDDDGDAGGQPKETT